MDRRYWVPLLVTFAAVPALLGMGGGRNGPLNEAIPRPRDNVRAELADRQGVTTRVELFSCAGKTFLPLARGEGILMVPFAKLERLAVGAEGGTTVRVSLTVEGGTVLEGDLSRDLLCTGVTEYGNYQVPLGGLRSAVLRRH